MILFIFIAIISYIAQLNVNRKFKKFSELPLANGMTGRDVAERMLQAHGIHDVKITCIEGRLTDHYNPTDNTVNLSREVYSSCSVAAAAVAAHECGHAVQHATAYGPLKMRSALVPVVSFASKYVSWILLIGILCVESFPGLLLLGIILFATSTLFSFITLPVEINAS
jgi:Zn-dependent membrane protease YugP